MPKPKVRNFIAQCTLIDSCLYSGSTTAQLQVLQFAVLPVTKLILQDRGHSSFDLVSYSPLKEDQNVGGTSCSVLILSSHKLPIHHMNLLQLFRNSKDMTVITLPPAPNWYSSCLVSCNHQGWAVFGAKNSLVFVQHQHQEGGEGNWREEGRGKEPRVEVHQDAHSDRAKVTSVCWTPNTTSGPRSQNLVSASEDGIVRAWHWVENASPCLTLVSQHSVASLSRARVTSLSWSCADPSLVLSSDDSGALVAWDLASNTTRSLTFGRNAIFAVAAHREVL